MIIVDSREQKWSHVKAYFERNSVDHEVHKLDFGDYMTPSGSISVDRKQNLDELAQNLCSADSRRFWNELRGASKAGIKLVILCEHGNGIKTAKDVKTWKSKYMKVTGQELFAAMFRATAAYGIEFRFCSKPETGRMITEILGEDDGSSKQKQGLG